MDKVLFYERRWYFFSNFSAFAVYWHDRNWPTVEHAYQAAKFTDWKIRDLIQSARSAHDAKKIAQANSDRVRPDWDKVKIGIMEEILRAKLDQHPYIRAKLMETGLATIIEDSPKDSFWGRGPDWKGENNLGKLWMKLRDELLSPQS